MVDTVAEILEQSVQRSLSAPAQRFLSAGEWRTRDYAELLELAHSAAQVLRDRGVEPRDRLALVLRTRADWTVIELASLMLGTTLVPLYPTATESQIAEALETARPIALIVEAGTELPREAATLPLGVLQVGEADGDLGDLADRAEGGAVWARTRPEDHFTISFSSGSTGRPKGCVILHRNYAAVLGMVLQAERHPEHDYAHRESAFIYLPLAHASARLQQLTSLCVGGEIVYGSGSTSEILAQITQTAPTYVAGVPRLFEHAVSVTAETGDGSNREDRLSELFGPKLRYALSGGAPLPEEYLAAYARAGVQIVDGYGLTESSTAVAIGTPHCRRAGSVGRPLPGLSVRIAEDGEVLVRGDNVFAGYLDDPDSTAEVLHDGWLHTGDLGHIDGDGFLFITGRKKNLIVTSTGKNISPEGYENRFRAATGVSDFVLVGDRWPYLVAIAAPNEQDPLDPQQLGSAAAQLNADLAPQERVRKIVLLDRQFSQELGELTASGKVMRVAVERNQRDLIARVYADQPNVPVLHVDPPRPVRPQLPSSSE